MQGTAIGRVPCTPPMFAEMSRAVLSSGVALRFRARGSSMAPLVRDGDTVVVRPAQPSSVQVGDVILYRDGPDCVLLHRVVQVIAGSQGLVYAVQGDRDSQPSKLIAEDQIHGRLAEIEREGLRLRVDGLWASAIARGMALRSRWQVTRCRPIRLIAAIVKRLPAVSRLVA